MIKPKRKPLDPVKYASNKDKLTPKILGIKFLIETKLEIKNKTIKT